MKNLIRVAVFLIGSAALGALGPVAAAPPPAKIAFTGARIITVSGDDIRNGTVLVENGRITAIGGDVELPYDAVEVDVEGKVLFPGMIDPHSWRGLDVPNENLPVTPFIDVYDAIDPSRTYFEETLRRGMTSVHVMQGDNTVIGGLSRVCRPIGRTPDEMTVRADFALKMSTSPKAGFDRMLQLQTLRSAFDKLRRETTKAAEKRYEEKIRDEDGILDVGPKEARERGMELVRDEDLSDQYKNLKRLVDGRYGAWIHTGDATDVRPAIDIASKEGFLDRSVFVLGTDAVRAVEELEDAGRPVVLSPELVYRDRDPITGDIEEIFIPKAIHGAGLEFALQPYPDSSLPERFLNYQAARCVREGIPRSVALKAITLFPARMVGMGDELGSLEVGKIANIVVFSGDPLEFDSVVEHVFIDGIHAYDRARDPRIQDLIVPEAPAKSEELAPEAGEKEADAKSETPKAGDDASEGGEPDGKGKKQ